MMAKDAIEFVSDIIEITPNGPWIAGGAARKAYLGHPLGSSDIDIFVQNDDQAEKVKADIAAKIFDGSLKLSNSDENIETKGLYNAEFKSPKGYIKVQLVKYRTFASSDHLMNDFDVTVSRFFYDGTEVKAHPTALRDHARNKIVFEGRKANVIGRLAKHLKLGYEYSPKDIPHLAKDVIKVYLDKGTISHIVYDETASFV